jgi:protein-S-isoprenylcysteine O-methyltransferase Ste14
VVTAGGDAAAERPYNRPLGIVRLVAVYAAVALLLVYARPRVVEVVAGMVLVSAGEAVRFWAAGHLHKNVTLVTAGPYRHTRNPLYLGRLLIFTGLTIMARLPWSLNLALVLPLGWAVFFLYYLPRKERVEPARLAELHGAAYETYRRAVPALFPTVRPYAGAEPGSWSRERMLRNREHWMIAGLAAVSAFLLWRALQNGAP